MSQQMQVPRGTVVLEDVTVGYQGNTVFSGLSFDIAAGRFVYVVGPSGSGKSTLIKMLHGSLRPDRGTVIVDGMELHRMHQWQTAEVRRRVGCVYQNFELLPHLTALQNVLLPLQLAHPRLRRPLGYAMDALELVGLQEKVDELPSHLSGGEQQRVAIAR